MSAGQQLITVENFTNPLATYGVAVPNVSGYIFSIANVTGVVAANNYLTLFNPVASGKTIAVGGVFVSNATTGASAATDPMRGFRISAAPTGGTVQAASTVTKAVSSSPATIADIRTGNPTVTALTPFFNSPAENAANQTTPVHQIIGDPGTQFILAAGEGIVLTTASGTVNQRWNISISWGEF